MTFLQPFLLAALPLVALPILIHLINQRRFQTIRWAAMMFLLAANRMTRGYARLRQWLILLFRMLAIAGLIFAISRPLAGGWLGLTAGGRPDTTIILLDRSPSMEQQGPGTIGSKLETGRHQLVRTLQLLGSGRWVLIENTTNVPQELESPDALLNLSTAEPTSASADLPAMLQAAHDYIRSNKSGRTEIWICSDIRQNDWNADSGRWQTLRDSFLEFAQGVRFHLLAFPQSAPGNVAVRVTDVRRVQTSDAAELLVSLQLTRESLTDKLNLPVQFNLEGARSEVTAEMSGPQFELKDHRIPLEKHHQRGWGKVSIAADANPADNDFYFVFDQTARRRTAIVSADDQAAQALQLTASISTDPSQQCTAEIIAPGQVSSLEWEAIALVLWHAPLPSDEVANALQAFVDRGGYVIFFPPRATDNAQFCGVHWQAWQEKTSGFPLDSWRGDQDLLAHTQSGAALPVGELQIYKTCGLAGEATPLAILKGGSPLLVRVTTNRGGVYFCATTPAVADSSLANNGVVLYVIVQRAIAAGVMGLGNTRQLVAGEEAVEPTTAWQQVAGPPEAISTDFKFHQGIYRAGEKLYGVNRAPAEDQATVIADRRVAELFSGLDFDRVDGQAGNLASLVQEIWRAFLLVMMLALFLEALLCMPRASWPRLSETRAPAAALGLASRRDAATEGAVP